MTTEQSVPARVADWAQAHPRPQPTFPNPLGSREDWEAECRGASSSSRSSKWMVHDRHA